jgi:hypothetical protein
MIMIINVYIITAMILKLQLTPSIAYGTTTMKFKAAITRALSRINPY